MPATTMKTTSNSVAIPPTAPQSTSPTTTTSPSTADTSQSYIKVALIAFLVGLTGGLIYVPGVGRMTTPPPSIPSEMEKIDHPLPSNTPVSSTQLQKDEHSATTALSPRGNEIELATGKPTAVSFPSSSLSPLSKNRLIFTRAYGTNSPSCAGGQPNQTDVEAYPRCPLPGLNNLLYTQTNRWYCAFRDRRHVRLRDRTCQKANGVAEPYRFSSIIAIDYERANKQLGRDASVCWGDWSKQDKMCGWADIPQFYGTPEWWSARSLLDFHPIYYRIADDMLRNAFSATSTPSLTETPSSSIPPFITVHLRRGDYDKHCKYIVKKEPAWLSFRATRQLRTGPEGCYPSLDSVTISLKELQIATGIKHIFVATNSPEELAGVASAVPGVMMMNLPAFDFKRYESDELLGGEGKGGTEGVVVSPLDPRFNERMLFHSQYAHRFREVDRIIVEMCIMIRGQYFLFNRYSSMSATVFEQARVNGNIPPDDRNVRVW